MRCATRSFSSGVSAPLTGFPALDREDDVLSAAPGPPDRVARITARSAECVVLSITMSSSKDRLDRGIESESGQHSTHNQDSSSKQNQLVFRLHSHPCPPLPHCNDSSPTWNTPVAARGIRPTSRKHNRLTCPSLRDRTLFGPDSIRGKVPASSSTPSPPRSRATVVLPRCPDHFLDQVLIVTITRLPPYSSRRPPCWRASSEVVEDRIAGRFAARTTITNDLPQRETAPSVGSQSPGQATPTTCQRLW